MSINMKRMAMFAVVCLAAGTAAAAPNETRVLDLWPGAAPGSEKWTQTEVDTKAFGPHIIYNVSHPTLTVYPASPERATGTAVIIAPGGGFKVLSIDSEGTDVARWLAERGITAFVLKYRTDKMPDTPAAFGAAMLNFMAWLDNVAKAPPVTGKDGKQLIPVWAEPRDPAEETADAPTARGWPSYAAADGLQALKVVRTHAHEWGYAPDRVGLMGFSAGAEVTYGVVSKAKPDEMPAFVAPIYVSLSPYVPIPAYAPPAFLAGASDDPISVGMPADYARWIAGGHKAELHMWASGGHGFGMNKQGKSTDNWIETFYAWLTAEGFATPKKK